MLSWQHLQETADADALPLEFDCDPARLERDMIHAYLSQRVLLGRRAAA
jgi:hypothetical protein